MVSCEKNKIIIFDLDGTLISSTTTMEIYSKVYEMTIKEMENNGFTFPEYLRKHGERWIEAFSYPDFKERFNNLYIEFIKNYDFSSEKSRIEKILKNIKANYCAEKIYVLSDNPFVKDILKILGLDEFETLEINHKKKKVTTIEEYYQEYIRVKSEEIEKVKRTCEICEIIYVGDLIYDELIAKISKVEYRSIEQLEKELYI